MGEETRDAVVVGSGFGGSIAALRLAEAGRSVLVLERGRRWSPESFPRDVTDTGELFWRYPRRGAERGLYDLRFFSGIGTVTAAGVGGGSLVYANIHIRPDAKVFDHPRWPDGIDRTSLDPYYDRVAEALGVRPVPPEIDLPKRDRFRRAAGELGREVFDPDQAVAWDDPDQPGRRACQLVAECEFGCPHGAKNTLDFTYLARAEELGAEVRTGSWVEAVEPVADGYRVHLRRADSGERTSVIGRRVVLSAGTLGTTEILLRSRDEARFLPKLSDRLGHGFSGNGDFLGSLQNAEEDLEPWKGPDVTSVLRAFDEAPEFTMAAPTFNRPVMEVLASLGQPRVGWLRFLGPLLWPRWMEPLLVGAFRKGLLSRPRRRPARGAGDPGRMTNLFAIGRDDAGGRIVLSRGELDVRWRYLEGNRRLVERMEEEMRRLAEAYGGTYAPLPTWQIFRRILSVHPLGGCHLSKGPEQGVVSPEGEVHGYPRLYVADGSVIPTSIGFHPVMTISAVAERIAEAAAR